MRFDFLGSHISGFVLKTGCDRLLANYIDFITFIIVANEPCIAMECIYVLLHDYLNDV